MFIVQLLLIFTSVLGIKCVFNMENVLVSKSSDGDRFFAYSLLLQRGEADHYSVIVGAPKNDPSNADNTGGDLYKCDFESWERGLLRNSTGRCAKYAASGKTVPLKAKTMENKPHGNLLGINVAGEDYVNGAIVACAPRELTTHGRLVMNKFFEPPFLKGRCVHVKNSSELGNSPVEIKPFEDNQVYPASSKYRSGEPFYDFAFSMAGFDVSYYSQGEILVGAPGVRSYNGATAIYSLDKYNPLPTTIVPQRNVSLNQEEDNTYFGYSVTAAEFKQNDRHWFVAGAPRGNNLKGKVEIFSNKPEAILENDEFGSYFGSSVLAVDVTGDHVVDILVGAPTAGGKTYDEGRVYFYKGINWRSFTSRMTLGGPAKEGARFGTSMVSLGDIDLDGYNDVAISAPHEDFGTGAVYIYKGGRGSLETPHSQRLSPENLGLFNVMGFGLGMSKGNDIDGNGHNDVAIGAYKSDTLFIFKTDSIVDFNVTFDTEKTIANGTLEFNLKACVRYSKRSQKNILKRVDFEVQLDMDYRLTMEDVDDILMVPLEEDGCKNYRFGIRPNVINDISPLEIAVNVNGKSDNVVAYGKNSHSITVPFVYGCGDDDICNTDLSVVLNSQSINNVILGLNKQIDLTVLASNDGEPAYKCEVKLAIPNGLELRNAKECTRSERNYYICLVHNRLVGTVNKHYIFDIVSVTPDTPVLKISAEITGLGENEKPGTTSARIAVPVVLDSLPYIVGTPSPENIALNTDVLQTTELAVHQFSIGKNGASPLPIDVDVFVPVMEQDGENVFNVVEMEATVDNMDINCSRSVDDDTAIFPEIRIREEDVNRTVPVTCGENIHCLKYSCKGGYLFKSGQLATFKVKMLIKPKLLVKKLIDELGTKDAVAYILNARQKDPGNNQSVHTSSQLLILVNAPQIVPLWVCTLAVVAGVSLLILLGYGLYKCNFFDRNYKDMLEQERVLGPKNCEVSADNDDFGDEVVLRRMKDDVNV